MIIATVALDYDKIENHSERISNIKSFITKCNWKEINFHHTQKTGKNLNKIIRQLLLISYMYHTILKK